MPDMDLYAMKNTVGFLDDESCCAGTKVCNDNVKPVVHAEWWTMHNEGKYLWWCVEWNSITTIVEYYEKHTKPRMLFFKGASSEDIEEFEEHMKF